MAGVGVVHGDMQREVVGIYSQLIEFVGGDEQVQRQLLIAQVESHDLGQELLRIPAQRQLYQPDRKSTRLNSSHSQISYAVFCLKKKNKYIVSRSRTVT